MARARPHRCVVLASRGHGICLPDRKRCRPDLPQEIGERQERNEIDRGIAPVVDLKVTVRNVQLSPICLLDWHTRTKHGDVKTKVQLESRGREVACTSAPIWNGLDRPFDLWEGLTRMERVSRVYRSFAEAEKAEREYMKSLTPQERFDVAYEIIRQVHGNPCAIPDIRAYERARQRNS